MKKVDSSSSGVPISKEKKEQLSSHNQASQASIQASLLEEMAKKLESARASFFSSLPSDKRKYIELLKKIKDQQKLITDEYEKLLTSTSRINKVELSVKGLHDNLLTFIKANPLLKDLYVSIQNPNYTDPSKANLLLYRESLINQVYNRVRYKIEILEDLNKNRELLEKIFNVPKDAELSIRWLPGETHNGGKKTVVIGAFNNKQLVNQFVYKPRDARIDCEIIRVFEKINELEQVASSSKIHLPTLKIQNLPENSSSIWEYIDGIHPTNNIKMGRSKRSVTISAGAYIKKNITSNSFKSELVRLDNVLHAMHVSDLHGENVILRSFELDGPHIFPIDLENVYVYNPRDTSEQKKAPKTKLDGYLVKADTTVPPLTPQELEIIQSFNQNSCKFQVRYIPIGTTELAGLITSLESGDHFISMLQDEMFDDEILSETPLIDLKTAFLNDVLNGDIPFFSEQEGIIYYGLPSQNLKIGEKAWRAQVDRD